VHQALQRYGIEPKNLESFKKHRADILADLQDKILSSIEAEDIKKAPIGSRVLAAVQLYDKEQIERGNNPASKPLVIVNKVHVSVDRPGLSTTTLPVDNLSVDITDI
jgi:hypothetical protein